MTKTSRDLFNLPLPCDPLHAAGLAARLEARLRAEMRGGLLLATLSLIGIVLVLFSLPEPLWARLLYTALLLISAASALAYSTRRRREARAVAGLRARLANGYKPGWLCESTVRDLLLHALREAAGEPVGEQ